MRIKQPRNAEQRWRCSKNTASNTPAISQCRHGSRRPVNNVDYWSAYYGNPAEFVTPWIHLHSFFTGDSNVKFAYDPNVAFTGTPVSTFTQCYPGSAYVDIFGLDGFDFGGQTFAQVFDASLSAAQSFGKPIWITSTGVVNTDNQSQFVKDMFAAAPSYNIAGIMYFNYQQFVLGSSALSTLKSFIQ